MIRVEHIGGLKVWILGRRVHHGLIGCILAVIGAGGAWHDRRDARCWVKDFRVKEGVLVLPDARFQAGAIITNETRLWEVQGIHAKGTTYQTVIVEDCATGERFRLPFREVHAARLVRQSAVDWPVAA